MRRSVLLLCFGLICFPSVVFFGSSRVHGQADYYSEDKAPGAAAQPAQQQRAVVDESAKVPEIDAIVDYCGRLPMIDQPAKSCDCLYESYDFVLDNHSSRYTQVYENWQESLAQAEQKILSAGGDSALIATQNFCSDYYGNPDQVDIVANTSIRDKAVMTPKFKDQAEKTAFINAKREVYQITKGASDVYCRAYFEVHAHERLMNLNPLAGKGVKGAYEVLSRTRMCHSRFR